MSNLHAALEYARAGIPVFPCKPTKAPLTENGFQDATTDPAQIKAWWNTVPQALIGMPCGPASGYDVLDVDMHGEQDGKAALAAIEAEYGELPETVQQTTANDGVHYLFKHQPGLTSGYLNREKYPGVEIRTEGAYIIVAPSVAQRLDGTKGAYEWEVGAELGEGAVLPWPEALAPLLQTVERREVEWTVGKVLESADITDAMRTYVAAAVEAECQAVIDAPNGSQERTLNAAALKLGSLVGAGALFAHEAATALEQAALQMANYDAERPWKMPDIKHKIEHGLGDGMKRPRDLSDVGRAQADVWGFGDQAAGPPARYLAKPNTSVTPYPLPRTDVGNRERLVHRWGHDLRYITEEKHWAAWDGSRWQRNNGLAQEMAVETSRNVARMEPAGELASDDDKAKLGNFQAASQSAQRISNMLSLATSAPQVARPAARFDAHPHLFNCANGTLDLETGTFRGAQREDNLTCAAPVVYDPEAACPLFDRFISQLWPHDPLIMPFIQRYLGYCLSGFVQEQKFVIWYGEGGNGKSTLFNTLTAILGPYGFAADAEQLADSGYTNQTAQYFLAELKGKRFVVASETQSRHKLSESLVKKMTGGDEITARRIYGTPFTYEPTIKVILATNHKPEVYGQDYGMWRRLVMVPFAVLFGEPGHPDRVMDMDIKLRAELPGIFNWLVRGYADWRANGLQIPPSIAAATEEYRKEEDVLQEFFDDCCEFGVQKRVSKRELHQAYIEYRNDKRFDISSKRFSKLILDRAHRLRIKSGWAGKEKAWKGIGLTGDGRQKSRVFEAWGADPEI